MLRERQAASFLGVAPKTLANWRSQGKGPKFCRLGRAIGYRQEDLDVFVADALTDPKDEPGQRARPHHGNAASVIEPVG
ncbi:MAG: helix-turn-helix domain-containing protein [Hyphomonadaceae bacterium]|nr:helix-turn-helix domain-containing protein [Hyphomonadaceae bacterium]